MFKGKIVLVVDDESDLREILCDEFAYEGAQVMEASNGREALELAQQHSFDIILSDIRMPGGDGVTLTRELRLRHPSHPVVILITGFADLRSDDAFALGADGYLTKPFRLEELKSNVSRLLRPPSERWAASLPVENFRAVKIPRSLEETLRLRDVQVGRGGLFIQMDPVGFRIGDYVKVSFTDFEALFQLRWHRSEVSAGKRRGLGLEFLQMTPEHFKILEKALHQVPPLNPQCSIPLS
jgi:DNA-binding response OmpR family regulator